METRRGPHAAEADGTGVWDYEIRVDNPGALPVDNIRVEWHFKLPVQRRRLGHLDPPTTVVELVHPVLAGGGYRVWGRKLVMNFEEAQDALPATYADLHFVDIEGRSHTNRWPRNAASS